MSSEAVAWALSTPIRYASAKFTLVVLAHECGPDLTCSATTVEALAEVTSTQRRNVQRRLAWLIAEGWLERHRVMGRCSAFILCDPRQASTGARFVVERQSAAMHNNSNSDSIAA